MHSFKPYFRVILFSIAFSSLYLYGFSNNGNVLEIQINGMEGPDQCDSLSPDYLELSFPITDYLICERQVNISATSTGGCSSAITITNDSPFSNSGSDEDASGIYPEGIHVVTFTAVDTCGTVRQEAVHITVYDDQGPVAQCLTEAVGMNSIGVAYVAAETLDGGSYDNCDDDEELSFYLQRLDTDGNPIGIAENPLVLDCDDLGVLTVRLMVVDGDGRSGSCVTTILLEDPNGFCGPNSVSIWGSVSDQNDAYVPSVFRLSGPGIGVIELPQSGIVDTSLLIGETYCVEVFKGDGCYDEGLSTLDILHIRRHLLDIAPFYNPYQYLAADIDGDFQVSTIDIVQLRRIILSKIDSMPGGTPIWHFVNEDYNFATANPLEHFDPASVNYGNPGLTNHCFTFTGGNVFSSDFVAVKTGDLNLSADPLCSDTIARPTAEMVLLVPNEELISGTRYSIPVFSTTAIDILGVQMALQLKEGMVMNSGIRAGKLNLSAEHMYIDSEEDHTLIISFDQSNPIKVDEEMPLFYLEFEAIQHVCLEEVLGLNQQRLRAEYYDSSAKSVRMGLRFSH